MKKEKSQYRSLNDMRVAIVHDLLVYPGGAEYVVREIADIFPQASIYTILYDKENMRGMLVDRDIRTSFLQRWPRWIRRRHRWLFPFYATAVESFDLRDYDLIISSSGAWSKGIVTRLHTTHIAYIHSPMRYVWDENEYYMQHNTQIKRPFFLRMFLSYMRVWDHQAAQRPDHLVANSCYTRDRIAKYYRRDADVIYPPVECGNITDTTVITKDHFLMIARLSEYKNIALTIETFNKLQLPLVIVGEGRTYDQLKKIAGDTVTITGWVSDKEKYEYLARARAVIMSSEEDFGIVCVEALQVGVPVIALRRGGACEIIEDGVTGEFFDVPTVEMMADALRRFIEKESTYDSVRMRMTCERFTRAMFKKKMLSFIDRVTRYE